MGYSTDFSGRFTLDKPLRPEHYTYLLRFNLVRHMKRDADKVAKLNDLARVAVGLPVGSQGCFYVGNWQDDKFYLDDSVTDRNEPPSGQPGLWCKWRPTEDHCIEWDGVEKFYDYVQWLVYLIDHFLEPWGYVLNGRVAWQGEDEEDRGTIVVVDNVADTE